MNANINLEKIAELLLDELIFTKEERQIARNAYRLILSQEEWDKVIEIIESKR